MNIRLYSPSDQLKWDTYVKTHPLGTHCHLSAWKSIIENAYHHRCYYFLAEDNDKIIGILPLVHLKSIFFGNILVSMPFLNYGGILADTLEAERALWQEAIDLGKKLKVSYIELRHLNLLSWIKNQDKTFVKSHKVRMLLDLPSNSQKLMKSFKSKLRSQIKRPTKEGMTATIGGKEFINNFYKVFSINMRDLGSPVHSKKLFLEIFNHFSEDAKIGVVFYNNQPVASGIVLGFKDILEIPWASSLRKFNRFSPNMLLYWTLLAYGCDTGYKKFDFGRSTPGHGTYKFKAQWGAHPYPLYWHYWINKDSDKKKIAEPDTKQKFSLAISCWQKLPVKLTHLIGPCVRKYIAL